MEDSALTLHSGGFPPEHHHFTWIQLYKQVCLLVWSPECVLTCGIAQKHTHFHIHTHIHTPAGSDLLHLSGDSVKNQCVKDSEEENFKQTCRLISSNYQWCIKTQQTRLRSTEWTWTHLSLQNTLKWFTVFILTISSHQIINNTPQLNWSS